MVVNNVERTNLVENTLSLNPDILGSGITRFVDNIFNSKLQSLEVVSGEGRFLITQFDEHQIHQERSQGTLAEGNSAGKQPQQGVNFQDRGQLNGFVIVGSDKVTDIGRNWMRFRDVNSWQDIVSGVG